MTRPPAPDGLLDAAARDAIANALDDTLVVEAAAGTGKTTELVKRIVATISTGRAQVRSIVAVTFTEKAAGELKLRLREALDDARARATADDERDRLNEALRSLEEAAVSTIHGFCAELLRERPVEARIDPLFSVLAEDQAERLFGDAFGAWIQEQLREPPEGVRRALRRSVWQGYGQSSREDTPIDRLRRAAWDLAGWRDFRAEWTRPPFDRDARVLALLDRLHAFADLTDGPSYARDPIYLDSAAARHLSIEIRGSADALGFEPSGPDGPPVDAIDAWEARLVDLSRDRALAKARHGRGPGYKPGVQRAAVAAALDAFRNELDAFRMDADADLAAALQRELRGAIDRYERIKALSGALDFLDLLLTARDLVRDNPGVRHGFQERFTHIFVDEFQDTDPLQAEILMLLAADDPAVSEWRNAVPKPGRLFIVGDPKQSIYRFRRADVGTYQDVCERLKRLGARTVHLTTSFRSVPEIQACVNAAFAPVMTGDTATLQATYVPLSPSRRAIRSQPAVVALPVPEPYGTKNVSAVAIEKSLPDAVGAFISWLVSDSGWQVEARGGVRPVQAKDVCILFRRFLSFGHDMTLPYVRALEARSVPHVLVGGKTFHDREEVEAVRAALAAIEWPDEELSVFATLRGPLFSIGDEELLEWKQRFFAFHPFRLPQEPLPAHLQPVSEALRLLQRLHRRRNYRPVAETLQEVLDATRAHVGLVLRTGGDQALANVLHIAELARQYEASGGLSFRGFVEELRLASEDAQAAEAPILEEDSDGVRIMTVHKAKGLEFPVVVLADLTCRLSRADAGRWIDAAANRCALRLGPWSPSDLLLHNAEEAARDIAEGERLAYVAATRARDVLVVPVIGDCLYDGGWLDPLMPAIYPPENVRRTPSKAIGCPVFKSADSVLGRPGDDPASPLTVAPGRFEFDGYAVTWFDPRALPLGAVSSFGLVRDDLIVKDGDMFAVEERLADYERWRAAREAALRQGARESVRFQTATAWAAAAANAGLDEALTDRSFGAVEIAEIPRPSNRPRGPRFGTLVHAILATVALDADETTISRTAETHGRIIDAPAVEVASAVQVARDVLRHDIMARARQAAHVRRETPVSWIQEDGVLIEGVLDLAFDEGARTIVVDFKTDHELSTGEARYRAQVQQYVQAVARATGRETRGILFRV
ncbi:MAG TPA: UvrD-helicase domain-containing protein [Vicinamibacterales bacterium]|jgi:ATP-dependent helicase/nuclease subunit A|nr:UvrD-helicase domain-containing protein [Vicinamibacterales bacterium]